MLWQALHAPSFGSTNRLPQLATKAVLSLRASYCQGDTLEGYVKLKLSAWGGDGYLFERYSARVVYQTTRLDGKGMLWLALA